MDKVLYAVYLDGPSGNAYWQCHVTTENTDTWPRNAAFCVKTQQEAHEAVENFLATLTHIVPQ